MIYEKYITSASGSTERKKEVITENKEKKSVAMWGVNKDPQNANIRKRGN